MARSCRFYKLVSIIMLSFGGGVLLTFLLPSYIIVILEAVLLIAAGLLYIMQK